MSEPDETPESEISEDRKRVVYGRRQGHKLHPRQAKLVDDLLPRLRVDVQALARPADWFSRAFETYALEIGFGGGEHLASRARAQTDVGFIGCEPFLNGVAKLLIEIDEDNLDNIAVHDEDARDVRSRGNQKHSDELLQNPTQPLRLYYFVQRGFVPSDGHVCYVLVVLGLCCVLAAQARNHHEPSSARRRDDAACSK